MCHFCQVPGNDEGGVSWRVVIIKILIGANFFFNSFFGTALDSRKLLVQNYFQFLVALVWPVASIFLTLPRREHHWLSFGYKFRVDYSLLVKEYNQYYFHSGFWHESFLFSSLLENVPFVALPFGFGLILDDPTFIPCNDIVIKLRVFFKRSFEMASRFCFCWWSKCWVCTHFFCKCPCHAWTLPPR